MQTLPKRWMILLPILVLGGMLSACGTAVRGGGAVLTVNSKNDMDDGTCNTTHCSLREAINKANTLTGIVTIKFHIGLEGAQTIQPMFPLPKITATVRIDGASQPGFSSTPLIELDGSKAKGVSVDGLILSGGGSGVSYLAINRFSGNGIRIYGPGGNTIQSNYIGTDILGMVARSNGVNGILMSGDGNTIGGSAYKEGNVVSANLANGVVINDGQKNTIQGNLIGTNATGTAGLGNHQSGIFIGGNLNLIGGSDFGARNVISDNWNDGVRTEGLYNRIQGNYIGTDINGKAPLGNHENGVNLVGAESIQIGGSVAGAGNVISANNLLGIKIDADSTAAEVYGNYIGTDATGMSALKNIKSGIHVEGTNHRIGNSVAGTRNLISGNGGAGIVIVSDNSMKPATGIKIQNNFIGTDVTGKGALGNDVGIEVGINMGVYDVLIGGSPSGEGNVISGNKSTGVLLWKNAKVQGNKIGTDVAGLGALGNGGDGILAKGDNNQIGGTGLFNAIAFNGGHGVAVISESGGATGNSILSNSIHDNGMLGIAIGGDTVIPNDNQDPDSGDNNLQNYPLMVSAISDPVAVSTTFTSTLNSTPNTTFTIEFFSNAACDPSGYGEGHRWVKTITVTTDANGNATLIALFPSTVFDTANFITATATDPAGNTSGFSNCIPVTQVPTPTPAPISSGMQFKPSVTPSEFFYGGCSPDRTDITLEVLNPPEDINYMLLFVRVADKKSGEAGAWSEGLSMSMLGPTKFFFTLTIDKLPDYDKFTDAWLQYQFVAYNKAQKEIGRSDLFGDVSFGRCGGTGITPTKKPGMTG